MPDTRRRRPDALAIAFFVLHLAIVTYVLVGWALPGVIVYLIFLPAMVLHWRLNRDACVVNNLESLIRTGHWRDPRNCEEGAWLRMVLKSAFGLELRPGQMDVLTYGAVAVAWGLGLWHRLAWQG